MWVGWKESLEWPTSLHVLSLLIDYHGSGQINSPVEQDLSAGLAQYVVPDKLQERLPLDICMARNYYFVTETAFATVSLFGPDTVYSRISHRSSAMLLPTLSIPLTLKRIGTAKRKTNHWLCFGWWIGSTSWSTAFTLMSRMFIVHW